MDNSAKSAWHNRPQPISDSVTLQMAELRELVAVAAAVAAAVAVTTNSFALHDSHRLVAAGRARDSIPLEEAELEREKLPGSEWERRRRPGYETLSRRRRGALPRD